MRRFFSAIIHWFFNLRASLIYSIGGKVVGARALVIRENEVLLVAHTYTQGWFTIGGGVDYRETPLLAIKRELKEEAGVCIEENPQLMHIYHNTYLNKDDYIYFYIVKKFKQIKSSSPEIEAAEWFSLNHLPNTISASTLRRIDEYLGKRPLSDEW